MRKKGCYHKNRPFRLLVAAALRFVQSYLNDIAQEVDKEMTHSGAKHGILKAGRRRRLWEQGKIQRGGAGASACKSVHGEGHGTSDFVHAGV